MRVYLTPEELDALCQACGEVTAGEMDTWEPGAAQALDRAWVKIGTAAAAAAARAPGLERP